MSVDDWLDDIWDFRRVVFQIGVLHDHNISAGESKTGSESRGLAGVFRNPFETDAVMFLGYGAGNFSAAISRAIVDNDHFQKLRQGQYFVQHFSSGGWFRMGPHYH